MELKCNPANCCSCFACVSSCRFDAIDFQMNNDGVLRPFIILDKCKKCGLCNFSCPQINFKDQFNIPTHAFAAFKRNFSNGIGSSSGSIASTLYDCCFRSGFKVYGVKIDELTLEPVYSCANSEKDLELFRGSKYVSPNPKNIYNEIKNVLNAGEKVLFIGLPCNVAALKTTLQKLYNNLYTIDLVCHGTPPFEYFKQYVRSKNGDWYSFRNKTGYCMQIYKAGKPVYKKKGDYDYYLSSFLSGLISKESCYCCQFARPERISDITIGDFHGLPNNSALSGKKRNVSLVLTNTRKGEVLFDLIKDNLNYEERNVSESISGNAQLNRPSIVDADRKQFLECYKKTSDFVFSLKQTGLRKKITKLRFKNFVLFIPRFIKRRIFKK